MAIPDLLKAWNRLTQAIYYGNTVSSGTLVPSTRAINTTAPITGGGDLSANRTIGITLTGGGAGAVGTGTTIATTAPLAGGGDLSGNLTLALATSPSGQTPVGVTRMIATTAPLAGGGDLGADRTLTIAPFTGAVDGIVTHNAAGVQGKFLKDDNTWGTSATAGVSDLAATLPITVSAATGSVTVAVTDVGVLTKGVAPATGGVDASKYLSATNPPTWTTPGAGSFVRLQPTTPGTADVGHAHISGSLIANGDATFGSHAGTYTEGLSFPAVSFVDPNGAHLNLKAVNPQSTAVEFIGTRGTLAAPAVNLANDNLGNIWFMGRNNTQVTFGSVIDTRCDGAPGAALYGKLEFYSGLPFAGPGDGTCVRQNRTGTLFQGTGTDFTTLAKSVLEVGGTFGLTPKLFTVPGGAGTYNYGVIPDSDPSVLIIDQNSRDVSIGLPSPTGRDGRRYTFIAVGNSGICQVSGLGALINGQTAYQLQRLGDSLTIICDGSNWWTESRPISEDLSSSTTDFTAVVNTAVETLIVTAPQYFGQYEVPNDGAVYSIRMGGKFSTTGTPTLQFKIKNTAGTVVADSTAVTCPNTVTDQPWYVEFESIVTDPSVSYAGRILRAALHLGGGTGGSMTEYSMMTNFGNPANGVVPLTATVQWGAADPANTLTRTAMVNGMTPRTLAIA